MCIHKCTNYMQKTRDNEANINAGNIFESLNVDLKFGIFSAVCVKIFF